ncbi:MAG: hypothetical protein L0196_09225 [candidate division Zixibacteria bacterium]|nr:hypothetical protein [candidate division Zixibacteria bacterium]
MCKICRFVLVLGLVLQSFSAFGQQVVTDINILSPLLSPAALPFELPGLELNFSGGGAMARGMGGAFTAVSGNLAAIGYNPAGLATMERPQFDLAYRYNRPSAFSRQSTAAGPGFENNDSKKLDQIDFGAVAAPGKFFGRPVVAAAAYNIFSDQFFADRMNTTAPVTVDDSLLQTADLSLNRRTSGKLAGFSLGAATRFGHLSVGTALQIYQGGFNDTTEMVFGPYYVRPANGVDKSYNQPVIHRQRLGNKVSYGGTSLLLGLQADYKNARLGVAARVPAFTLGETDFFRLKSDMDVGLILDSTVSGVPSGSFGPLFFTDSRLELPLSLSTGLSYLFERSLLVDFDYTYTNWGAADLKVRRIFSREFSNLATLELGSTPVGLTSTHQLRLGFEYGFNPGFGQMFIRGGLRNLPLRTLTSLNSLTYPIEITVTDQLTGRDSTFTIFSSGFFPVYTDSFVIDAQGNVVDTISTVSLQYIDDEDRSAGGKFWQKFGASFGLGVRWNQIAVDFAYDYTTYRRNSYSYTPLEGLLTTSRRVRQHRVFVNFTGYFTRL